MSALLVLMFFGGWNVFTVWNPVLFPLKTLFMVLVFILVRAVLPRFRYDNLMALLWKIFLPLSFGYLLSVSAFFYGFDLLPFSEC
jgi:NADH-quinone oxidoreductase subunit H